MSTLLTVKKGATQRIDQIPLTPRFGSAGYTPVFGLRVVGPFDLKAGDRVLITAREQLDNDNSQAGGIWRETLLRAARLIASWTEKGLRYRLETDAEAVPVDPRWTLWVGANMGVIRTRDPNQVTGVSVIRENGENWDNWIHHWHWNESGWDLVTEDAPGSYYVTTCWLDTNPLYRLPYQSVRVRTRGGIEAAVYR